MKKVRILSYILLSVGMVNCMGGVKANKTATAKEKLTEERKVQPTYETPKLLDTTYKAYLLPVKEVREQEGELTNLKALSSSKYRSDYSYYFSNFVYFDFSKKVERVIFKNKVKILNYNYWTIDTTRVLVFEGWNKDTNKDGKLNADDLSRLFVYYVKEDVLKAYDIEHTTVLDVTPMVGTDLIYVQLGEDSNRDNVFDRASEPKKIKVIDVKNKEIKDLISKDNQTLIENNLK